MKKLFVLALLLGMAVASVGDSNLTLDRRGAVSLGGRRFQMVFYNNRWVSYPQYTPMPGYYRIVDKSAQRVLLELNFPEAKEGTLSHELTPIGKFRWKLRTEYNFPGEVELRSGGMVLQLPCAECRGRKLWINGKTVICPAEPAADKKAIFYRRQCRELRLPERDGEWIFRGNFFLLLQDNRCFRNGKDFELRFSFTPETPGKRFPAALDLEVEFRPPTWQKLDLTSGMNQGLVDAVAGDGKGGWTDQGPENDLHTLLSAPEKLPGEFQIADPARNGGRGCIMLRGKARNYFPQRAVVTLPSMPKGDYLYLLHALAWRGTASELGQLIVTYSDGTMQKIPVQSGRDADNWWRPSSLENGEVTWIGENASSYIGLYRSMFLLESKPAKQLEFHSAGNAVWGILAATVSDFEIPRNPVIPSFVLEGNKYRKLTFEKEVEPGSILDFSARLDAPAGKYGAVVIRNGRFEFRDRPGIPARFYGTNLCSQAVFPDHAWAERLADRIAKAGFNAVRLHHHDALLVRRGKTTDLDPVSLACFDELAACLKRRGVYLETDLFVSRRLAAGEIPGYPGRMENFDVFKALLYLDDSAFENWKSFVRNFLNHVNPHTGFAWKDEPALIALGLVNEGNIHKKWDADAFTRRLYLQRFGEYLAKRKLNPVNQAQRNHWFDKFLTEVYEMRLRQMVAFVRSLGCEKPLSDQNMGCSPKLGSLRLSYDFVDNHLYYNHPEFAGKSWGLPSFSRKESVLRDAADVPAWLFASRIYGKPFIVTEFDFARPNPHRAEGALLFGVYAGLQGWDGLFQFAYTHGMEKIQFQKRTDGYFDLATDPVKILSQYLGVAFFLNGELADQNPGGFYFPIPSSDQLDSQQQYPAEYARLGLMTRLGGVPANSVPGADTGLKKLPALRSELQKILKGSAPDGIFRAADGRVVLNPREESFLVVTPQAEAFVLPAGKSGQGRFWQVKNHIGAAVFGAIACDGHPLERARRILLLHLTDSAATKMRYSDQNHRRLEEWGTLPFLAARGEAEVWLKGLGKWRCFALNTAGRRMQELPVQDGRFALRVFQPVSSTFCYELIRD